jgi:hypothetical protein
LYFFIGRGLHRSRAATFDWQGAKRIAIAANAQKVRYWALRVNR